jgi:hypothetical protein
MTVRSQGRESSLLGAKPGLDMNSWPAPIVRLFLGEVKPDIVFTAADEQGYFRQMTSKLLDAALLLSSPNQYSWQSCTYL